MTAGMQKHKALSKLITNAAVMMRQYNTFHSTNKGKLSFHLKACTDLLKKWGGNLALVVAQRLRSDNMTVISNLTVVYLGATPNPT